MQPREETRIRALSSTYREFHESGVVQDRGEDRAAHLNARRTARFSKTRFAATPTKAIVRPRSQVAGDTQSGRERNRIRVARTA